MELLENFPIYAGFKVGGGYGLIFGQYLLSWKMSWMNGTIDWKDLTCDCAVSRHFDEPQESGGQLNETGLKSRENELEPCRITTNIQRDDSNSWIHPEIWIFYHRAGKFSVFRG